VAIRLFVGNMPYGATEADLRAHFSGVGEPSQIVIPVDRDTGRPRGFAFVEFMDRAVAEAAISKFNQQPFMGRSLSVSEARPREERPAGGYPPRPGGPGGGFGSRPPGGGFGGPRPMGGPGSGGGFRPGAPRGVDGPPSRFGPPKKKSASSEKRWETKERGPKGPIKERYTGRLGGLYDAPDDAPTSLTDFDDPASTAPKDDDDGEK
jgi:RNA recognition motif-containing protein